MISDEARKSIHEKEAIDKGSDAPELVEEPMMTERLEAFSRDLEHLINCHNIENLFDVPDFILADYIGSHLFTLAEMSRRRDEWFGFKPFGEKPFSGHPYR